MTPEQAFALGLAVGLGALGGVVFFLIFAWLWDLDRMAKGLTFVMSDAFEPSAADCDALVGIGLYAQTQGMNQLHSHAAHPSRGGQWMRSYLLGTAEAADVEPWVGDTDIPF